MAETTASFVEMEVQDHFSAMRELVSALPTAETDLPIEHMNDAITAIETEEQALLAKTGNWINLMIGRISLRLGYGNHVDGLEDSRYKPFALRLNKEQTSLVLRLAIEGSEQIFLDSAAEQLVSLDNIPAKIPQFSFVLTYKLYQGDNSVLGMMGRGYYDIFLQYNLNFLDIK